VCGSAASSVGPSCAYAVAGHALAAAAQHKEALVTDKSDVRVLLGDVLLKAQLKAAATQCVLAHGRSVYISPISVMLMGICLGHARHANFN
jgi:hypothetical protein